MNGLEENEDETKDMTQNRSRQCLADLLQIRERLYSLGRDQFVTLSFVGELQNNVNLIFSGRTRQKASFEQNDKQSVISFSTY